MSKIDEANLIKIVQEEVLLLQSALQSLLLSLHKCRQIGQKDDYTFEEQESFDSLTSKFNRTSDLYTQKVLRTTWMLMHEAFVPFIDMLNKAEKMGIVESADILIEIRDLRNQIAHEYIPQAIQELVPDVLELIPRLEENIQCTFQFLNIRNWN